MNKHRPVLLGIRLVTCACGWDFKIPPEEEYGIKAGRDRLLDEYNFHVKAMKGKAL